MITVSEVDFGQPAVSLLFFFFFTLDRPRSENLSFEMINRNLLGDARKRKFSSSLFPRVVAPSKVWSGLDEDSAGLSLIDL